MMPVLKQNNSKQFSLSHHYSKVLQYLKIFIPVPKEEQRNLSCTYIQLQVTKSTCASAS